MSDLESLVWAHSLLALALKSTLILGCALIATVLLRKRSAALRHWIWGAALGSCLLLPVAMIVVPQWLPNSIRDNALELAPNSLWQDPLVASVQKDTATSPLEDAPATQQIVGPHSSLVDAEQGRRSLRWMKYSAVGWASISGLLLLLFILGLVRTRVLVRAGFPVVDNDWRSALQEAKDRSGVDRYVRLLESKTTRVPLAAGFLSPSILLPVNAKT